MRDNQHKESLIYKGLVLSLLAGLSLTAWSVDFSTTQKITESAQLGQDIDYFKDQDVEQGTIETEERGEKTEEQNFVDIYNAKFTGTDAQVGLALMYLRGGLVKKDVAKAIEIFENEIKLGNTSAMSSLGTMYLTGEGVKKDSAKAVQLLQKAADLGNVMAQYNLGMQYYLGENIKQNYGKAFKLLQSAANQGISEANAKLGTLYLNGFGVEKNKTKAVENYKIAAEKGSVDAQKALKSMNIKY